MILISNQAAGGQAKDLQVSIIFKRFSFLPGILGLNMTKD